MPESFEHHFLVQQSLQYIQEHSLVKEPRLIKLDSFHLSERDSPPMIEGYRPDLFYEEVLGGMCLIGEAKTGKDLDRPHTKAQICAFLGYCKRKNSSLFLLAVPWDYERRAKNLAKHLQTECGADNVKILVLRKLKVRI